jgi:hypothetical protein
MISRARRRLLVAAGINEKAGGAIDRSDVAGRLTPFASHEYVV